MGRLLLKRSWFVLLLASLTGAAAFYASRGATQIYEHTAVFVLRPSSDLEDAQIPDAVRGIAQQDAQLVQTVSRVIETDRFLREAFARGVSRLPDPQYELASSISPGSDVIVVSLRGPDRQVLAQVLGEFTEEASAWVADVYRAYSLELLELTPTVGTVSTSMTQTVALAVVLGFLLGVGIVFVEYRLRAHPSAAPVENSSGTPIEDSRPRVVTYSGDPSERESPAPIATERR